MVYVNYIIAVIYANAFRAAFQRQCGHGDEGIDPIGRKCEAAYFCEHLFLAIIFHDGM